MTTTTNENEEWGSERMFRGIHDQVVVLSHQGTVKVLLFDDEVVLKVGSRVLPSEELAMRLVKENTDVPVPEVYLGTYTPTQGRLAMSVIPGSPLKNVWDDLPDDGTKKRIRIEIWGMIEKLRQNIHKPPELNHLFLCLADGSPCINDPLVAVTLLREPPSSPPCSITTLSVPGSTNATTKPTAENTKTCFRACFPTLIPRSSRMRISGRTISCLIPSPAGLLGVF